MPPCPPAATIAGGALSITGGSLSYSTAAVQQDPNSIAPGTELAAYEEGHSSLKQLTAAAAAFSFEATPYSSDDSITPDHVGGGTAQPTSSLAGRSMANGHPS